MILQIEENDFISKRYFYIDSSDILFIGVYYENEWMGINLYIKNYGFMLYTNHPFKNEDEVLDWFTKIKENKIGE
jgi:hypothetical protein